MGNDNAIRFDGIVIDIAPGPGKRSYAGLKAELRQLLDGSWRVYYEDKADSHRTCNRDRGTDPGKEKEKRGPRCHGKPVGVYGIQIGQCYRR